MADPTPPSPANGMAPVIVAPPAPTGPTPPPNREVTPQRPRTVSAPPSDVPIGLPVGTGGLRAAGGIVLEEFLPELAGLRGMLILREMSENDPAVGAMLQAIDTNVRGVTWRMNPADETPVARFCADFAWECLRDMQDTFAETVSQIFSFLPFGWSWHEMVFKLRQGPEPAPLALAGGTQVDGWESKFNDKLMGFAGWMHRGQDTLVAWEFDALERVTALHQRSWVTGEVFKVGANVSLHFRTSARKGNPEGRTILRNAYRPWYFKKRIEEIEAIGVERDLAGLPIAWAPSSLMRSTAGPDDLALLNKLAATTRAVRRGETEGLLWPLEYDENGNKLYDFTLLSTGGSRQFDTSGIIGRYDARILLSCLTDFLLIGQEGTSGLGQGGLSVSKIDLFRASLKAWMDIVVTEINERAMPLLMRMNGWPLELTPQLSHNPIAEPDLSALADYVSKLSAAGMPIFPDYATEAWLRDLVGLPAPDQADTTL